jgi:hypothetical protein
MIPFVRISMKNEGNIIEISRYLVYNLPVNYKNKEDGWWKIRSL